MIKILIKSELLIFEFRFGVSLNTSFPISSKVSQAAVPFLIHPLLEGFEHFSYLPFTVFVKGGGHLHGIGSGQNLFDECRTIMNTG